MTTTIAGVDEAGRGPLAGPVCAAAVILDDRNPIEGLADSKVISEKVRERLAVEIRQGASAWSVAFATAREIDELNILQATFLAMRSAVAGLSIAPTLVMVDGNRAPAEALPVRCIVGGDRTEAAIMAASIVAVCGTAISTPGKRPRRPTSVSSRRTNARPRALPPIEPPPMRWKSPVSSKLSRSKSATTA